MPSLPDVYRPKGRPQRYDLENQYHQKVVLVEESAHGFVITFKAPRDKIDPIDRERAAHWLKTFFPCLSHDERYLMLWGV